MLVNNDIEIGKFKYLYINICFFLNIVINIYYYYINSMSQYNIINFIKVCNLSPFWALF